MCTDEDLLIRDERKTTDNEKKNVSLKNVRWKSD